ncbi:hypothetical protein RchiOBHm_Chr2g0132551 [Rosa chinensis]|uniref:Uncharacterized protein n=1 Tax=Rosa chinensis TaxID=74649 RepID=A0A2P6RVC7_ROSCH|nr:hypothetical protein RchiOBHm_Chr2g0132551 [Rosa chinensis]
MSDNMESSNFEPFEHDSCAEAVTSIPDSSRVEGAVSPLLNVVFSEPQKSYTGMNLTTMRITPMGSNLTHLQARHNSFTATRLLLSAPFSNHYTKPSSTAIATHQALKFLSFSSQHQKQQCPNEKGMKPQFKAVDFKWIRRTRMLLLG